MKKGHYGKYTGNARHSRKEEMIHDREMIYDAKTQIHNEDKKYRETGKDSYKQDMIHERELIHDTKGQLHKADSDYKGDSPAHLSYSSKFGGFSRKDAGSNGAYTNYDGAAAAKVAGIEARSRMLGGLDFSDLSGAFGKKNNEETNYEKSLGFEGYGEVDTNEEFDANSVELGEENTGQFDIDLTTSAGGGKTYTDRMAFNNLSSKEKSKYDNKYENFHQSADNFRDKYGKIKNITFDNKTRDKDASDPSYNN